MRLRLRHLAPLAAAVAACTQPADTAPARPRLVTYTSPVVLFVQPDSAEVARLHAELGDDAFYTTADDAMWYQAQALALLDSLGVAHAFVRRGEARFGVRGRIRPFGWKDVERSWFVVVYNGVTEPFITSAADLNEHPVGFAPARRGRHRPTSQAREFEGGWNAPGVSLTGG